MHFPECVLEALAIRVSLGRVFQQFLNENETKGKRRPTKMRTRRSEGAREERRRERADRTGRTRRRMGGEQREKMRNIPLRGENTSKFFGRA